MAVGRHVGVGTEVERPGGVEYWTRAAHVEEIEMGLGTNQQGPAMQRLNDDYMIVVMEGEGRREGAGNGGKRQGEAGGWGWKWGRGRAGVTEGQPGRMSGDSERSGRGPGGDWE